MTMVLLKWQESRDAMTKPVSMEEIKLPLDVLAGHSEHFDC